MSHFLKHIEWMEKKGQLRTANGKDISVWEFHYQNDEEVLSSWAKHFRNHYCLDSEIDYFRRGCKCSRADYLNNIKFPDAKKAPGPSIRAGDFSEILVADFMEYFYEYWVPRTHYSNKTVRNESTKGSDVIGFHIVKDKTISPDDLLAIFEVKAQFSGKKARGRLQNAVDDSNKDYLRKAESLNAIRNRLYDLGKLDDADKIMRFQNEADHPYKEIHGAVAVFDSSLYDASMISSTDTSSSHSKELVLLVIRGDSMMDLVQNLYKRAADEA